MQLNVNDAQTLENPPSDEVSRALRSLEADQYAILEREEQHYVQTYFNDDGTYQLEYRAGGDEQHFGIDPDSISLDQVCEIFTQFLAGNDLSQLLPWQAMSLDSDDEDGEPYEEVEYNGVMMDASWPPQIEAAQEMPTMVLGETEFARIAFGKEVDMPTAGLPHCGDCGVLPGQLHVPTCDIEQCPKCHGQMLSCGCDGE